MKIGITADSTCDLPKEYLKKYPFIRTVPISVIIDGKEYREGQGIDHNTIYNHVNGGGSLPSTAAIGSYDYEEVFKEQLQKFDAIIHISLSSGISSSFANASMAVKNVENVFIVDSKSVSGGSGMIVLSCAEKIVEGKGVSTILDELNEEINKLNTSFIIAKLNYLHKGGRCSGIAVFGANLLKLKIKIDIIDGVMKPGKKYRGQLDDVILNYAADLMKENSPNFKRAYIISCRMPVVEPLTEYLLDSGFEEVIAQQAGSVICAHCGENTLGIMFFQE